MKYLLLFILFLLIVVNNSLLVNGIIELKKNWKNDDWLLKILGVTQIMFTLSFNLYVIISFMQ